MHICFIIPDSYSLFNLKTKFIFGGSELRASVLAKGLFGLSKNQVSVIVSDHGQRKRQEFDGIRVYSHPCIKGRGYWERRKKLSGRLLFRFTSLFSGGIKKEDCNWIYKKVNAGIYMAFGVSDLAWKISNYCQVDSKKFALFISSDTDLSEKYYENSTEKDVSGNSAKNYWNAIQAADIIFVQSQYQLKLLKERFGREAIVLPNPVINRNSAKKIEIKDALWVGKTSHIKQPEIYIELARRFPGKTFRMILNNVDNEWFEKIKNNIPPNLELIERVPPNEIESYFASARIFVNTSAFEGFPNTFLQAGKYGVPLISLCVNPDNIINQYKLGFVTGMSEKLIDECVNTLLEVTKIYEMYSKNIKNYVLNFHDEKKIINKLNNILLTLNNSDKKVKN